MSMPVSVPVPVYVTYISLSVFLILSTIIAVANFVSMRKVMVGVHRNQRNVYYGINVLSAVVLVCNLLMAGDLFGITSFFNIYVNTLACISGIFTIALFNTKSFGFSKIPSEDLKPIFGEGGTPTVYYRRARFSVFVFIGGLIFNIYLIRALEKVA